METEPMSKLEDITWLHDILNSKKDIDDRNAVKKMTDEEFDLYIEGERKKREYILKTYPQDEENFTKSYLEAVKNLEVPDEFYPKPYDVLKDLIQSNLDNIKISHESRDELFKEFYKNRSLKLKNDRLKLTRNLLIGVIITIVLATFCNPYEVKVGSVCLSCWGN